MLAHRAGLVSVSLSVLITITTLAQRRDPPIDLETTLTRAGARVEQYYARATSLICREELRLQPVTASLMNQGPERRIVSELRVSWEPTAEPGSRPEPSIVRQVLTIDERPPRPGDEPGCLDPKATSPEPLAVLLDRHRVDYVFSLAGSGRTDGRASLLIDYVPRAKRPGEVTWRGDCFDATVPMAGRVWIDAETGDVLRLDERLVEKFEFPVPPERRTKSGPTSMLIERAESSVRYERIRFRNPDETLMLPVSATTFAIVYGSGVPAVRTSQRFSDWKRFLTDGRLVFPTER